MSAARGGEGPDRREKMPAEGPGRPKFIYSKPPRLRRQASITLSDSTEVVVLTFESLKRLCRFRRGGICRRMRDRCEAENYPQIMKIE